MLLLGPLENIDIFLIIMYIKIDACHWAPEGGGSYCLLVLIVRLLIEEYID